MLIVALFLLLTVCILTHSELSIAYAYNGLTLWFRNMIPVLLPFMILSGCLIRMGLSRHFSAILYPAAKRLLGVSPNGCYAFVMGFLCGFPMGARVTADLLRENLISEREASYLLAFCNNIGPIYFFGVALPLLRLEHIAPYLIGMYGIPLCYGMALRRTLYRSCRWQGQDYRSCQWQGSDYCNYHWQGLNPVNPVNPDASRTGVRCVPGQTGGNPPATPSFWYALEESVTASLSSILTLGGYMVLFNLLNLPFHILLRQTPVYIAPLLEITGGLKLLGDRIPLYSLILLSFGGISCIAQTYSCIRETSLSLRSYTLHRLALTGISGIYYCLLFLAQR